MYMIKVNSDANAHIMWGVSGGFLVNAISDDPCVTVFVVYDGKGDIIDMALHTVGEVKEIK